MGGLYGQNGWGHAESDWGTFKAVPFTKQKGPPPSRSRNNDGQFWQAHSASHFILPTAALVGVRRFVTRKFFENTDARTCVLIQCKLPNYFLMVRLLWEEIY